MRSLLPVAPVVLAALLFPEAPAEARPEFARREEKACGYCHINPRGGGARNQTGLLYARSEFRFPVKKGDLTSFSNERQREAMIRARKLIDLQHIPAAVKELRRLARSVKDEGARKLVAEELHGLEVKGEEILGKARLMLRGKDAAEGVELLVMLDHEYKDLEVHDRAKEDLREIRKDADLRDLVKKEQREAKARLALLDAVRREADGDPEKAKNALRKVIDSHPGTRAAEDAANILDPPPEEEAVGR